MFVRKFSKQTTALLLRKLSYIHNAHPTPLIPLTFGQQFEETCKKHGQREAVYSHHQNKRMTFQEVLNQADQLAAGLEKIGMQPGDRLGIWAPNIIEWIVTNLACARSGLIVAALNPAYQASEIEYCINKVGIKTIVCIDQLKSQNYYNILEKVEPQIAKSEPGKLRSSVIPSLKNLIMIGQNYKSTFSYDQILDLPNKNDISKIGLTEKAKVKLDDSMSIQFTSGTTGKPKAAHVSHFMVVNNGYFVGHRNELSSKHHKIAVQVPLFHAFGIIITISAATGHGATLVLPSPVHNPTATLTAASQENCTIFHGTPTMYVDLISQQSKTPFKIFAEIAVSGGACCSPHLFKQMTSVLGVKTVKSVYGLSETTAVVFHSLPGDDEVKSTSTVGFIGPHMEAKVVDEFNKIVPRGTPGELCLRGYANMLGYWGDEEKTKAVIGEDRWLKTGDQFVLDKEGYGQVVGRLKEMIIRGGENIFPKEIEDFLNTHPDILETHVVGLPHERLGEEVCACIRTRDNKELTQEDIKQFATDKIAKFKIPSKVQVVKYFPRTTSGKIQKFKIVKFMTEGLQY